MEGILINVKFQITNEQVPQSSMKDEVVLLYYVALEPGLNGNLVPEYVGDVLKSVEGYTADLGKFTIK